MLKVSNVVRLVVVLWVNQVVSAQYPKCYEVETNIWPEPKYTSVEDGTSNGFKNGVVLGKCQTTCARKHSATFCGIRRNGRTFGRARCYCGDDFDNLESVSNLGNCSFRCNGNYCGFIGESTNLMSVYTVCSVGHYGEQCSNDCPENCAEGVCQLSSGDCHIGCKTSWYGEKCTQSCGNCKNGCIQSDGKCEPGGCKSGFYGEKCDRSCSNCKNGCQQKNGICGLGGCKEGYHGLTCNDSCPNCINGCIQESGVCLSDCGDRYYGSKCDLGCPQNCLIPSCIKVNGQCKSQCKDGWYSLFCDKTCPVNCKTRICGFSDGSCSDGCTLGWEGQMCESDVDECSYDNNVCASQNRDCYNTEGSYRCCEPYQGFDQFALSCTGTKRSTFDRWILPFSIVLGVVIGIAVGIGATIIFQKSRRSRDEANKTKDACNQSREFELQPDISAGTYSNDVVNEGQYENYAPNMNIDINRSYERIQTK